MPNTVEYSLYDGVAVLSLNNPPVNSLGAPTRSALREAFRKALSEASVRAIVITAKGQLFSAGADISEFQINPGDSSLRDLFLEIEASTKPTTAAINGVVLGGALELALVCHHRVANTDAQLGLPEVNIGVIPGAGGTQRLPRLIGVEAAVDIITTGKPLSAESALAAGLLDAILPSGEAFLIAAIEFARESAAKGGYRNSRAIRSAAAPREHDYFESLEKTLARPRLGVAAPLRALESIKNSTFMTLDEGLAREADIFTECNASAEGRALQHIFFAERKVTTVRGMPTDARARHLSQVAIVGAGTMGGGIAMNFLNAGIPVTILDLNTASLEKGLATLRKNYEISVARGRLTTGQVEARIKLLSGATTYDSIANADLVIEAVFENLDAKKGVFRELDRFAKPGAILATNTSTLDVNVIAAVTNRPNDVVGLHFFSPANVMRLVEIVCATKSAPTTIRTAFDMCKQIGKVGVAVGVCYGFVGNRMLEPYGREANRLLLEGATVAQVDGVLTKFGMSMGPLAVFDLAGIDIGASMRLENKASFAHDPSYYRVSDVLAERGDKGQKTGRGFYVYQGREKSPNPDLHELIEHESKALGIQRRSISDQEVLDRCLYSLIDEGLRILDDKIAQRPGDIDVIWCNGYGFPSWRGGPMWWADEISPKAIFHNLLGYRRSLGAYGQMWFQPSRSLELLAQSDRKIADLFPNG